MRWPVRGKGRRKPGEMNETEKRYAQSLDLRVHAGEILWWMYEGMTFRLAKRTTYTPDFNVMLPDGEIECHEVKGFWIDDARVKIKVAAEKFPFVFKAYKVRPKKDGGGFEEEVIG